MEAPTTEASTFVFLRFTFFPMTAKSTNSQFEIRELDSFQIKIPFFVSSCECFANSDKKRLSGSNSFVPLARWLKISFVA